ncbi:MAG: hypothetical protein ACJAVA_000166 [Flavobacteriaceae bacterium]|jgi:hypothetical protein
MAYKIVKYKGKTQIKDTKSGKSTEINIEKFMNGGYKDINNFSPGGVFTDEDSDEIDLARQNQEFMNSAEFKSQDSSADNLYDPIKAAGKEADADLDESMGDLDKDLGIGEEANNRNYNMPNPYGGVDLPSAANYLGQSIKNGDALGGTVAGIKVAAGLGRNIMSGMGQANREQYTMSEALKNLKKDRNVAQYMQNGGKIDYLANGGKKDEEMITSEYMSGVENEKTGVYNAEIEDGEYFQTNQGDIAEVVGNKHSQGGEKVNMEAEDRVLSDKLKLGAQQAKSLASKYDLKLKAKNTYSDVLDKFRKKTKLDKLVEEEASMMKKIGDQQKVEDTTTRDFNIQVLSEKVKEIQQRKEPIEEARKGIFDELFNIQEDSKPKDKQTNNSFEDGGKLSSLAEEYGISIDRAKELIQNFKYGGKKEVPKYQDGIKIGDTDPKTGKKVTREEAMKKVKSGEWEVTGNGQFIKRGTPGSESRQSSGISYSAKWDTLSEEDKAGFSDFEDFKNKAISYNTKKMAGTQDERFYTEGLQFEQLTPAGIQPLNINNPTPSLQARRPPVENNGSPVENNDSNDNIQVNTPRNNNGMGMYLFPDEQPLPPSSLQGTIKPIARYDRVSANEIAIDPYLQDIRNREQSQVQSLEGLSPNVRAAVLANMRGNSQNQESDIRNKVDTQNLQGKDRATYTNAQIQQREQNQNNNYNQGYENRIYTAQANQERDLNDYYSQLQSINKQKFMDVQNLNLANASNEDVYFDGQNFKRKQGSSNKDLSNRMAKQNSTNQ